ncbi:MAG: DUF5706 domain-containing protein [Deltaproteobacteria bacterium]|jgi:hypothetical protein|nr:DUF5706 domain-containing protein [Deltaproteobacteria bacterium]
MVDIRTDLRYICAEVTSALRYAESKHAAFMAFNGAAIFGAVGTLRSLTTDSTDIYMAMLLYLTMILLTCAMLTSMCSFLPQFIEHTTESGIRTKDNILFFEHIKLHTVDSYIENLRVNYGVDPVEITPLDRCLILQIIVNAQLSSRKFRLFRWAAYFDLAVIIMVLCGFSLRALIS